MLVLTVLNLGLNRTFVVEMFWLYFHISFSAYHNKKYMLLYTSDH